jgi:hypothetical protein
MALNPVINEHIKSESPLKPQESGLTEVKSIKMEHDFHNRFDAENEWY